MGWASGSGLAETVWDMVREHIPAKRREALALEIYNLFSEYDADDWDIDSWLCYDSGKFQEYLDEMTDEEREDYLG